MSSQKFYVRDTCLFQGNIVIVDVDTHQTDVASLYPNGLTCHASIPQRAFRAFLRSGIPPRHTALVSRIQSAESPSSGLVPESELKILDRDILIGDIVKRDPRHTMSGTVIGMEIEVYLSTAARWTGDRLPPVLDSTELVGPISARDIAWPPHVEVSDIVIYHSWVGRVADCWQDVTIRLANGSVVVPENEDDIIPLHSDLACEVGDSVTTKKSNLRRGRWIFGSYDPNIEPQGVVLKVETTSIAVDWLGSDVDPSGSGLVGVPNSEIGQDILQSGDLHLYDPQLLSCENQPQQHVCQQRGRSRLDVNIGDVVRFHDLSAACDFYNSGRLPLTSKALERIPRQDTLGYDINWFLIARKETSLLVRWQDMSESNVKSCDVVPTLDLDDDEDVWPGEVVCTRASKDNDRSTYTPRRVGVVQSVNAKDRFATVKWFEGVVSFPADDKSVLLPGSWTGNLDPIKEDLSLYDIWTVPALTRRPGDFVILNQFHHLALHGVERTRGCYEEVDRTLSDVSSTIPFFGEIINLGIDGAVQVRLGATTPVRDISVPFECTHVIHTTGWDQDGQDHMNEDADSGPLEHAMAAILGPRLGNMSTRWMDENDEPIDDTEDWEDEDVHMENGQPINEEITHYSNDRELPQANETKSLIEGESDVEPQNEDSSLLDHVSLVGSTFSYANMLSKIDTNERPEPMMILEGTPPVDHHFSQSISEQNPTAKLLRRVQHEVQMLQSGLPEGVFVRSWEQAINLFRVMFIGPVDTPYEYVPIVIDLYLHDLWPNEPPKTFFHSWTDGTAPINPNLYEDGKICLSLLGTWPGEEQNQGWTPKSTLLQLVVSILGLVLVKEPYFNEAGFEVRAGSVEARIPSALYSERTYFRSRSFIKHAMGRPIHGFEEVIDLLYRPSDQGPNLLIRAIWSAVAVLHRSQGASSINLQKAIGRIVSRGALMPLRREIKALIELMADNLQSCLTQFLEDGHIPQGGPGGTFDELASFTESKFSHTATQA